MRLAADGVHMLIVRPGFVESKMTTGLKPAPFATTPEKVADATVKALRAKRRTVWVPGMLRLRVLRACVICPAPSGDVCPLADGRRPDDRRSSPTR